MGVTSEHGKGVPQPPRGVIRGGEGGEEGEAWEGALGGGANHLKRFFSINLFITFFLEVEFSFWEKS